MGTYMISLFTPLLLHMLLSEAVVAFFGNRLDTTTCTTITAIVVIPIAVWMYRKDRRKERMDDVHSQSRRGTQAGQHTFRAGKAQMERNWSHMHAAAFGVFCFAAGAVLNVVWSGVLNRLHIYDYFSNQTQETLLESGLWIQLIGLGLLVPAAEELIFRGLIYRRMKHQLPVWAAVFFSGALFALYHGNMIQIIFAFPMALALALVYEKGGLLVYPILFHMGANLVAVLLG